LRTLQNIDHFRFLVGGEVEVPSQHFGARGWIKMPTTAIGPCHRLSRLAASAIILRECEGNGGQQTGKQEREQATFKHGLSFECDSIFLVYERD
jgi:hypothetical protein